MAAQDRPVTAADTLRASSWVIAFGVGLARFGGTLLEGGLSWPAFGHALTHGVSWFGGTLAAIMLLPVVGGILGSLADAWATWDAMQAESRQPPPAPPPTPTHVSLAGDLDEAERYVQDGLRLTLEHARRAGALTGDAIGAAFGHPTYWQWWTDVLALSGLAVKVNGKPTVLPEGRTYAWALRQVRLGYFELPATLPPTLPPHPAPLPAEGAEKLKV